MNSPFNLSRKYNTIAAVIGGTILLSILISFFLIAPAWKSLKQLGQEVPVEQQKRDNAEAELAGLEKAKAFLADQTETVDQVNIAVPIEPQVPQILLVLEQLARDNAVSLTSFQPQIAAGSGSAQTGQAAAPEGASPTGADAAASSSSGNSVDVTANFEGDYAALISYFYTLEKSLRIIDVKSINVATATGTTSKNKMSGSITFSAYYKVVDGGPKPGGGSK